MAELYHVSLSTVRRTLVLLESLGVTKSHMGIGTEVCLGNTDFNWNAAEIREVCVCMARASDPGPDGQGYLAVYPGVIAAAKR